METWGTRADRGANSSSARRRRRALLAPATALAAAALLAACGSSSSSSNSGSTGSGSSATTGGSASSGSGTSIAVGKVAGFGSVLTSAGQPVYVLSTDPSGSSKCAGACAKTWKPVSTSGSPQAGSGAQSSLLSDFKRSDGSTQVLYNKHALYTHSGSAASVAGTASDGGVWYLLNAKGAFVKSTTAGGY